MFYSTSSCLLLSVLRCVFRRSLSPCSPPCTTLLSVCSIDHDRLLCVVAIKSKHGFLLSSSILFCMMKPCYVLFVSIQQQYNAPCSPRYPNRHLALILQPTTTIKHNLAIQPTNQPDYALSVERNKYFELENKKL